MRALNIQKLFYAVYEKILESEWELKRAFFGFSTFPLKCHY